MRVLRSHPRAPAGEIHRARRWDLSPRKFGDPAGDRERPPLTVKSKSGLLRHLSGWSEGKAVSGDSQDFLGLVTGPEPRIGSWPGVLYKVIFTNETLFHRRKEAA